MDGCEPPGDVRNQNLRSSARAASALTTDLSKWLCFVFFNNRNGSWSQV